jgi:prevent-host-death family protein
MGLREANQHFSKAMKAVRAGEPVVLTERGEPIAIITPFRRGRGGSATLERLARAGLVRRPEKEGRLPIARPSRVRGPAVSEILTRERDER